MRRKIWLDGEHFIACEVVYQGGGVDSYLFCSKRREELIRAMKDYGFDIIPSKLGLENEISVNRAVFYFQGEQFTLKQCSDIFEWFGDSCVGQFTYYYDRVVFHHTDGKFYAAYIEDTTNFIEI